MKIVGVILIVLGILGFFVGELSFVHEEEVLDVGPLQLEQQKEESVPIRPWVSGAAVAAGAVLLVLGSRSKKE